MTASDSSGHDAEFLDCITVRQSHFQRMTRSLTGPEDVAGQPVTAARHEAGVLPDERSKVRLAVERRRWSRSLLGPSYRGITNRYLAEAAGLNAWRAPLSGRCRCGATLVGTVTYAPLPRVTGRHRNRALTAAGKARAVEVRAELIHAAGRSVAAATQGDHLLEVGSALTTRGAPVG